VRVRRCAAAVASAEIMQLCMTLLGAEYCLLLRRVLPTTSVSDTPRYGYDYPCQGTDAGAPAAADVDLCRLQPVTFQDVSCSDAAGAQRCYYEIMACK
jgi:hypothetical protein